MNSIFRYELLVGVNLSYDQAKEEDIGVHTVEARCKAELNNYWFLNSGLP